MPLSCAPCVLRRFAEVSAKNYAWATMRGDCDILRDSLKSRASKVNSLEARDCFMFHVSLRFLRIVTAAATVCCSLAATTRIRCRDNKMPRSTTCARARTSLLQVNPTLGSVGYYVARRRAHARKTLRNPLLFRGKLVTLHRLSSGARLRACRRVVAHASQRGSPK